MNFICNIGGSHLSIRQNKVIPGLPRDKVEGVIGDKAALLNHRLPAISQQHGSRRRRRQSISIRHLERHVDAIWGRICLPPGTRFIGMLNLLTSVFSLVNEGQGSPLFALLPCNVAITPRFFNGFSAYISATSTDDTTTFNFVFNPVLSKYMA